MISFLAALSWALLLLEGMATQIDHLVGSLAGSDAGGDRGAGGHVRHSELLTAGTDLDPNKLYSDSSTEPEPRFGSIT
ncbi:MAG: hypothetical protein H0V92_07020 [Pseudonocardiales bacterium]|nr:hypothetical protein [Pseudonocardiales bacterium]